MNKWRDHSREIKRDKNIIAAFDSMDVCVNVMSTLPHANVHMQVCVHDVWVGITNQLCFSRFFKVISHLRHWWLMTFAEIRQTLYSPPIPQIVWRAQGEYLHGWMSFPYKPLTLQPLSWSGCRLSIAFSGKGAALLSQYHPLCSLHLWNCKIQLWVN